ncbi:MAG: hypoxanthine phosphoribosyltransferase [Thermoguttaceae bacterium]|nr:hypoxanthine phosphoribosyltransferase [Thermoguttaceae bacterium]
MSIQVLDKVFSLYISEKEIQLQVQRIAEEIQQDFSNEKPFLVCILKGALFFFADLLEALAIPCDLTFYRVSSYSGLASTENIQEAAPFPRDINGRKVIIVDDLIDTGNTMEFLISHLKKLGASEVRIASLFFKPGKFKKDFPIDYYGMEISDEFIVGYGLDYDEEGRNYPDIYRVNE